MKKKFQNINLFLKQNKQYIVPLAVATGFIFDMLTLTQIDRLYDNIVLISHLTIIGVGTLLLCNEESVLYKKLSLEKIKYIIETIIIFSFGAIFSGFIIFYTRSGSLTTSWPFIMILLVLMIGTELKKQYYKKNIFRISFFYLAIITYNIFAIPILFREISTRVFFLSIFISLVIIAMYLRTLYVIHKKYIQNYIKKILSIITAITLSIVILFATNILPPVPLSMKFKAVYYNINVIEPGSYIGIYQATKDINFLRKRSRTLVHENNSPVFVFTSIFAPDRIQTTIYHIWEYRDSKTNKWIQTDKIALRIAGGRSRGYRGFTQKRNILPGTWRVIIENEKGQRIGTLRFHLDENQKQEHKVEEVIQ